MNTYNLCVFCGKLMEISVYVQDDIVRTCHNCGIRHYDMQGIMAQYYTSKGGNGFYVQIPEGVLVVKYEEAV